MRTSVAALALFRRTAPAGRVEYLAQWNEGWHAYHFVGGHKRDNESFRDCCVREVSEELGLVEGRDFRVATEPHRHLCYTYWSERAQADTAYTIVLFDAELLPPAAAAVEADADNRWLTDSDIRAGHCRDGRAVSDTMLHILSLAGLTPGESDGVFRSPGVSVVTSSAPTCRPLVLWTVAARRHLRQALAEVIGRRGPDVFATTMNDLDRRLRCLFRNARAIVVQDQYTGFRRREDEFILLVEIDDHHRPGRHVVKLASPERLAAELAAWESCRPYGLRHDLVFMTLEPGNPDGPLDGLVYGDAQQFLGDVPAVYLEAAFLGAVRHGSPSPAAVADTLVQLYERIGHLLYRQSFLDNPADPDFVLNIPRLEESFPVWTLPGGEPARARQDVNTWARPDAGWFRDPVDYLEYVCQCVPWLGDIPFTRRPERHHDTPAASDLVPRMLRGCSHGDLHGRNVLVAIVRERARWPAVFDYEHMTPANLLAWDFVKMEVELKVRAYAALFEGQKPHDFIRSVQDFEVELAEQTEACHDGRPWPKVRDKVPRRERLRTLLLTLRRQAALHLGIDASRPSREWLHEYYFILAAYGVHAGRFPSLGRPNLLAGYVSAGVACARFLGTREERL
jgi:ADP-ribose pyrophosphatase YjhB (NUDIX family)